jgi:hypothetical protein
LLGCDLAEFATPSERRLVATFLDWVRLDHRSTRARIVRRAPAAWRHGRGRGDEGTDERVLAQFGAFARGLRVPRADHQSALSA